MSAVKNTEMTATSQHEYHPGAESLNAFAEQALDARERGQVLEHLAACARCRQVVSLAREAAEADAVPAAQQVTVQPNAWWKKWRLVWVPSAVAAAFAMASIAVFIHQAAQREGATRIAQQAASSAIGPATTHAPTERAETASQAPPIADNAPAERASESRKHRAASSGAEVAIPASKAAATLPAPPPAAATETVEVAQDQPKPEPVRPRQESATEALPQVRTSVYFSMPSVPRPELQNALTQEKKQIDTAIGGNRLVAGKAAPTKAGNSADSATRSNGALQGVGNASAEAWSRQGASSRQLEMRPETLGSFAAMKAPRAASEAASPVSAVHLPSGLAALSIASANHRSLAIDTAGALYASDDSGIAWRRVTTQWSGRAVLVLTRHMPIANAESAPAAQMPQSAAAAGTPAEASDSSTSSSTSFFEILNDKNQIWWSADGLTWIAK
jgi:hypothetical protein